MNWSKFENAVPQLFLAGTVVTSWSLTQEVAGSNTSDDKYLLGKTQLSS